MIRLSRTTVLATVLAAAGFAWGAASVRYQVFPYGPLARALSVFGGSDAGQAPKPANGADSDALADIADAPYLQGDTSAIDAENVTHIELERTQPGLNLVISGHEPAALLQDLKGNNRHRWHCTFEDVWAEPLDFKTALVHKKFWRRAHVMPNGDLLAIFEGIGMVKLDRDSNVIWANQGRYHHDIFVGEDGRITTLSRWWRTKHKRFPLEGAIEEDYVAFLSPDGKEIKRISILSALLDSDYSSVLAKARKKGDFLHTNTVEVMDGRFAERHPMFAAGNVLISIRELNTVAMLDPEQEKIVWTLSGLWSVQHQPTILDDGRMLVFDNLGAAGKSRVLELDPITQEVFWSYTGTPQQPLFSKVIGSSQRLANGNTLITESTQSRALEVTREGDMVWEYYNPYRTGPNDELAAWLCEVVRIDADYFDSSFEPAHMESSDIDTGGLEGLIEKK